MPYGEVMKFRAKSCEREENAWVPGGAKGRGMLRSMLIPSVDTMLNAASPLIIYNGQKMTT